MLSECILDLQNYLLTSKWQINQPILLNPLYVILDEVEGVQTVKTIKISNISGTTKGYSEWAYDINGAIQNGTIFPSL